VAGSEATGMIFNPVNPLQFVVNVQHPETADLENHPGGFGDSLWVFNVAKTEFPCAEGQRCPRVNPVVTQLRVAGIKDRIKNIPQTLKCRKAIWEQMHEASPENYLDDNDD
jgi:hypothetical protein